MAEGGLAEPVLDLSENLQAQQDEVRSSVT